MASNIQIVEISPPQFEVNVVRAYVKKVKVVPRFRYSLGKDYALVSKVKIFPGEIEIKGPKKLLSKIKFVNTEQQTFEEITKSFSTKIPLEKIEFVKFNPNFVTVSFEVDKQVDKTFKGIHVETKYVPRNQSLEVIPPTIDVTLRGALKLLANYSDSNITAYVTFKQALNDTVGTIEPKVEIPPFTELLYKQPERLKYIIKKY